MPDAKNVSSTTDATAVETVSKADFDALVSELKGLEAQLGGFAKSLSDRFNLFNSKSPHKI